MRSRSGFSSRRDRYRFGFAPVSIPNGFSSRSFGTPGNESIGIRPLGNEFDPMTMEKGKEGSRVWVRGEAESKRNIWMAFNSQTRRDQMQTGIGAIIEVKEVVWVAENRRYPAENRYLGELETTAGERVFFISDIPVPVKRREWKAVGRLKKGRTVLEIADHDDRENERL